MKQARSRALWYNTHGCTYDPEYRTGDLLIPLRNLGRDANDFMTGGIDPD